MEKIASDIAIGSDLELFLYDNEQAKVVPCVGILEGTKDKPYAPEGYPDGYGIQEDNVMVEFNIPPAHNVQQFTKHMLQGKRMVLQELNRRYGTKYSLYTRSHVHKFRARDLRSRQAQLIGCEPDRDAYVGGSMRVNPPAPGLERACGGHIHLGGDFNCPDFVAALFAELFIGVIGQVYAKEKDPRAAWYGQPGIFRSKPYGIEYRTPNNSWAKSRDLIERVGQMGLRTARYLTENDAVALQRAFRTIPWVTVREYITGSKRTNKSQQRFNQIISACNKAEVPV